MCFSMSGENHNRKNPWLWNAFTVEEKSDVFDKNFRLREFLRTHILYVGLIPYVAPNKTSEFQNTIFLSLGINFETIH